MYQIEKWVRQVEDAPNIKVDDLLTMADASEVLGISLSAIDQHIRRGNLSCITSPGDVTAYRRPRRWLLKSEVNNLANTRSS